MLRCVVRGFGPAADVAGIERYEPRPPGPGEVRVRMAVAAVNPSDLVTISGAYASRTALPFVPGFEGVGVVTGTGTDVRDLGVGTRVLPIGEAGAWQQEKVTEARWCFPVLPELTDEQAATSYINPMTAILMLDRHLPAGEPDVAVDAAASATGRMLIRMLGLRGVRPVALVRGRHSAGLLRDTGVRSVHCTADDGPVPRGRRFDLVLDAVGGPEGEALLAAVRPGGTFVHYGLLSGRPIPPSAVGARPDVTFVQFRLRSWVHSAPRAGIEEALRSAQRLVADGTAGSPVAAVHPLAELRTALTAVTAPGRAGKVLIDLE